MLHAFFFFRQALAGNFFFKINQPSNLRCMLRYAIDLFLFVYCRNNASVNSAFPQPFPPLRATSGYLPALLVPGGGGWAFANFALPWSRAFANPRAIPELLTRTLFPNGYSYKEGFTGKKNRLAHLSRTGINCRRL